MEQRKEQQVTFIDKSLEQEISAMMMTNGEPARTYQARDFNAQPRRYIVYAGVRIGDRLSLGVNISGQQYFQAVFIVDGIIRRVVPVMGKEINLKIPKTKEARTEIHDTYLFSTGDLGEKNDLYLADLVALELQEAEIPKSIFPVSQHPGYPVGSIVVQFYAAGIDYLTPMVPRPLPHFKQHNDWHQLPAVGDLDSVVLPTHKVGVIKKWNSRITGKTQDRNPGRFGNPTAAGLLKIIEFEFKIRDDDELRRQCAKGSRRIPLNIDLEEDDDDHQRSMRSRAPSFSTKVERSEHLGLHMPQCAYQASRQEDQLQQVVSNEDTNEDEDTSNQLASRTESPIFVEEPFEQ